MSDAQKFEVWKKVECTATRTDDGWLLDLGDHLVRIRTPAAGGGEDGGRENPVHFGQITFEDESEPPSPVVLKEIKTRTQPTQWVPEPPPMTAQNVIATKVTLENGTTIFGTPQGQNLPEGMYVSSAQHQPGNVLHNNLESGISGT